jgi:hypothetical protein
MAGWVLGDRLSDPATRKEEVSRRSGPNQNDFQKLACFSAAKSGQQTHHVYHAIHHNFTTKTPPRNITFSQDHPLKHQQSRPIPPTQPR